MFGISQYLSESKVNDVHFSETELDINFQTEMFEAEGIHCLEADVVCVTLSCHLYDNHYVMSTKDIKNVD